MGPEPQPEATAPPPAKESAPGRHARLLVVDDNDLNREMLSRRLELRGYEVAACDGGQAALELLEQRHFDLVLLDVMMPGVTGLDVLKAIRKTHSRVELPVIMATARTETRDLVEALSLGANDYVTKPLDFPLVLARTEAQLSLAKASTEVKRLARGLELRNEFIRETFGRYLSDEVVSGLLGGTEGLRLGGEKREVTILMSDLRGFTSVEEALAPEVVVRILNNYLGAMVDVIEKHRGTIDEFIGDAILVLFGAPVQRTDDARRAVACAVDMQLAMVRVNEWHRREGLPEVEMGIALNTGPVVVGNIGSKKRAKYGVVGSHVNLTSRIESFTVGGQVLASESTLLKGGGDVLTGRPMEIQAKGFSESIVVHEVKGIAGEYELHLPESAEVLRKLDEAIPVRYSVVSDKQAGSALKEGGLARLSLGSAALRAAEALAPFTNLRIRFLDRRREDLHGDVYAKVIETAVDDEGLVLVRFTSVPLPVQKWIAEVLAAWKGGEPPSVRA